MTPKVFLRLKRTDLYYARIGGWTPEPDRAVDFRETVAACAFSQQEKLSDVEIIMRTENGDSCIQIDQCVP